MGQFCFMRHGESESNIEGVVAGWTDVALTARGRDQVAEAAERLAGAGITAIYSSHLTRAIDTAGIVAGRLGLDVAVRPALAERKWGALEGRPPERRAVVEAPPGGESLDDFVARLMVGLAEAAPPGDGLPLIVSHSGVFRAIRDVMLDGDRSHAISNRHPLILTPPVEGSDTWTVAAL